MSEFSDLLEKPVYWTSRSVSHTLVIVTARKRSLGQGNVFTPVCLSTVEKGVMMSLPVVNSTPWTAPPSPPPPLDNTTPPLPDSTPPPGQPDSTTQRHHTLDSTPPPLDSSTPPPSDSTTPLDSTPTPRQQHHPSSPPDSTTHLDSTIAPGQYPRSTSGRYASYWNSFFCQLWSVNTTAFSFYNDN